MATIKISDLSVGDWVRTKDGNVTVDIISPLEVVVMNDYGNLCACKIEDIEPIPITAEILEKNGFVRGQRGDFYHYIRLDKNRTLYIHASTNGWRVEITYDAAGILRTTHLMPDMNSVHDLQHALRLAGVDKEINL